MTRIENEAQYRAAIERVEELLPIVDEDTPSDDENFVELLRLSNLVADYEEITYPMGKPSLIDLIKLRIYEFTSWCATSAKNSISIRAWFSE